MSPEIRERRLGRLAEELTQWAIDDSIPGGQRRWRIKLIAERLALLADQPLAPGSETPPKPWEAHWDWDRTGYPCFYIHGLSGDQKRDEVALGAMARLIEQAPVMQQRLVTLTEEKHGAYGERNRLVALLSKLWPSHLAQHPDDPDWDPDWLTIVCIHAPFGQLSWHIKTSERDMFSHLREGQNDWDGHSTDEKYARIAAYRRLSPSSTPEEPRS